MRIAMLTWEYPPRIVGGIARHCYGLTRALVKKNCEVHVITLDFPGAPQTEKVDGVNVYRVTSNIGTPNFLMWVLVFNHFMEKQLAILSKEVDFEIIHVHDWLTVPAGITAKSFLGRPLIFTVHSTEIGRSQGLYTSDSYTIDNIEWSGTYEASRIIVASNALKDEICDHFKTPAEKIDVIYNAIDPEKFEITVDREKVKGDFGLHPQGKLILCVGRLSPQKGIEYLIEATPLILEKCPDVKFVIVGDGWQRSWLQSKVQSKGYEENFVFTGFVSDETLIKLILSSDVLVVPSIYEPFGIVALEGMAAGIPVVVSQTGGLTEIIQHDKTGVWVYPRNPKSIAWGIDRVLSDPSYARVLIENAKKIVKERFTWDAVAEETIKVYEKALGK